MPSLWVRTIGVWSWEKDYGRYLAKNLEENGTKYPRNSIHGSLTQGNKVSVASRGGLTCAVPRTPCCVQHVVGQCKREIHAVGS